MITPNPRSETCRRVPKTNVHVCTSLVLDVLLQIIEKLSRLSKEGAIVSQHEDDLLSNQVFGPRRCVRKFSLVFTASSNNQRQPTPRRSPNSTIRCSRQCDGIYIYNAHFPVFGTKADNT